METKKAFLCLFLFLVGTSAFVESDYNGGFTSEESNKASRVAGGGEAYPGSYPHMVALVKGANAKALFCGGSIIGNFHILTAAHCTHNVVFSGSSAVFAIVGTNDWTYGGQLYTLEKVIAHPYYNSDLLYNDIAIFFTTKRFVFGDYVKPVKLSFDWIGEGMPTVVSGWGSAQPSAPVELRLRELGAKTIDSDICIEQLAYAQENVEYFSIKLTVNPELSICTFHAPGHGTCQGDSGSALLRSDTYEQIGIVSWGLPCGVGAPDVFTRVSTYITWIHQTMSLKNA